MLAQQIKEELNTFKMVRPLRLSCLHTLTGYRKWRFMNSRKFTHTSFEEPWTSPLDYLSPMPIRTKDGPVRLVVGHLLAMISDCRWLEHSMYMIQAYHIRLMNNVHAAYARTTSRSLSIQLFFMGTELDHALATRLYSLPYNLHLLPEPKKRGRGLHIPYLLKRLRVILAWVFSLSRVIIVCGKY